MRILFIGDIVGRPGLELLQRILSDLRSRENIDLVVANAENATNGSGLSPRDYRRLIAAGVDLVTLGDHAYRKKDVIKILEQDERICRPANFPASSPGKEVARGLAKDGTPVAVFCLLGRTYMRPCECPFRTADRLLAELQGQTKCIVVDMHAEATADKYLMVHHLKGRVSAVLGTHTHVPTADEQIFAEGTAFICDVGMTGPYASILGRKVDPVLAAAVTFVPAAFDVASDDVRLGGAVVDIDPVTGLAQCIRRIVARQEQAGPPIADANHQGSVQTVGS